MNYICFKGDNITMVKTAVLVSGGGSNLQALLDAKLFGELKNCELSAVISSAPDVYALKRAEYAGIPSYVVDASIFPNRASFTEAILQKLHDLDIELVVLAGFKRFLEMQFYRAFKDKVILTHPSLRPAFSGKEYVGISACKAAIDYGVRYSGATTYVVTDDPCSGPIILQKPIQVLPDDTPDTLQRRITEDAEWEILPKSVSLMCEGRITIAGNRTIIG